MMNYTVNKGKKITLIVLSIFVSISIYACSSKKIELKANEFELPVNSKVSTKADTYFKNAKEKSEITFEKNSIDISKLGTYDLKLTYDKKEYTVKLKVVDNEKPIINVNKKLFVILLSDPLLKVNQDINKEITITDNYDKTFKELTVIEKMPSEETEMTVALNVKDSSGNKSDVVEIKVQFTKSGKAITDNPNPSPKQVPQVKKPVKKANNGNTPTPPATPPSPPATPPTPSAPTPTPPTPPKPPVSVPTPPKEEAVPPTSGATPKNKP